jgi:hypothetical protein
MEQGFIVPPPLFAGAPPQPLVKCGAMSTKIPKRTRSKVLIIFLFVIVVLLISQKLIALR